MPQLTAPPTAATDAAASAVTGNSPVPDLSTPAKAGKYTTGFCGGTVVNSVYITNEESLHRMCRFDDICSCKCHAGTKVWEGAQQMFDDAKAGRRVTPSPHFGPSSQSGARKRPVRGAAKKP